MASRPRKLSYGVCCAGLLLVCLLFYRNRSLLAQAGASPVSLHFSNITDSAGIKFTHFKGNNGVSINREEFGPGVCVADFDVDGWQDIYFVNGRDLYDRGISARNALYRNNGNGTFTDVTEKAGVPGTGYGLGCVWGDYDNDGFPDLFVTQYGRNVLYRNKGDGSFKDATDKAGVAGLESGSFHSGATFFDYDRDGYLDLYVGSYVTLDPDGPRYCNIGSIKSSCPPSAYKGSTNALYHNNGDGTFTNVTRAMNMLQPKGKNLSVGAADYDSDGWPDLFVANDGVEAYLYHNQQGKRFEEIAVPIGIAFSAGGHLMAAMCISLGDYDNDGWLDLYISDFQGSSDHVWHNDGNGNLDEVSDTLGIIAFTHNVLSFGGGFFDYDNDGWLDLFIGNGHVYPEIEQATPGTLYKQLNSLFHNEKGRRFSDATALAGIDQQTPHVARGVAFADLDNDGFVDIVVADNGDPPLVLRNDGNGNHFLNFRLIGTKSNRDAMGARIRVIAGGISQIREIAGGGSYLSQSDLRANFGLGSQSKAQLVEITWPSGRKQSFRDVSGDNFYVAREGENELHPQHYPSKAHPSNAAPE